MRVSCFVHVAPACFAGARKTLAALVLPRHSCGPLDWSTDHSHLCGSNVNLALPRGPFNHGRTIVPLRHRPIVTYRLTLSGGEALGYLHGVCLSFQQAGLSFKWYRFYRLIHEVARRVPH